MVGVNMSVVVQRGGATAHGRQKVQINSAMRHRKTKSCVSSTLRLNREYKSACRLAVHKMKNDNALGCFERVFEEPQLG